MTANSVAVLAACGLLLAAGSAGAQGANPASDAPEHRPRAIERIDAPRSYEEALLRWRAAEDINAWIGAQFDYDMARALRLSEAQRGASGPIAIYRPEEFFTAPPRRVCGSRALRGGDAARGGARDQTRLPDAPDSRPVNLRLDLVVPAVVILLLLGAAIEAAYLIYIARISRGWPTAPGQVVAVRIETRPGSRGAVSFRPTIDYRYQVKGRDYQGSRIDLTYDLSMAKYFAHFTTQGAARVLDGYVSGCPVAVYYKPNHPEYSLLKPGASWSLYIVGGTMILAIVVFVGIWTFLVPF